MIVALLLFITRSLVLGQKAESYTLVPGVDVLHYDFKIALSDESDTIKGKATINFNLGENVRYLKIDLTQVDSEGKGMVVSEIERENAAVQFSFKNNRITIPLHHGTAGPYSVTIHYQGVPADGLIIGRNKFGHRTFFGDNYPDRGRNWLPCVDFPADKATVTWTVAAPSGYRVVANGVLVSEEFLNDDLKVTTWNESVPISTKLMVIGVSPFVVHLVKDKTSVPISYWVYPENADQGISDYSFAPNVLNYFVKKIGPFPYEKLAHVQSKTKYGGMENASNIFYFENSVDGKKDHESLIVHETAHQWFGDAVTEASWPHAWLSEGFASYMTHVYIEDKYGVEKMRQRMKADRRAVIDYSHLALLPVVNRSRVTYPHVLDVKELLSTNTYKKGAWVLHMLRHEVGDKAFWSGIRQYYRAYKNSIASTDDLKKIMEQACGYSLESFFHQWLEGTGQPKINGHWSYNADRNELTVQLEQTGSPFSFPLELAFLSNGVEEFQQIKMDQMRISKVFVLKQKPDQVVVDPHIWLLYEGPSTLPFEEEYVGK